MAASSVFKRFPHVVKAAGFITYAPKSLTATATLTRARHGGRTVVLNAVAGFATTLPAATGTGDVYRVVVGTTLTSATYVVKVANSTDVMAGGVDLNDTGDSTALTNDFWPTASTSDTYTMTQSIGGGKIGDWIEFQDIKAGFWAVNGQQQGVTDPTTPFSATV